jgi:hypothetical protein
MLQVKQRIFLAMEAETSKCMMCSYSLSNEASISFNEAVGKILKQKGFEQKFSAKYIDAKLKSVFTKLISEGQIDLEMELSLLIEELDKFKQESVVFSKIEGVTLADCFELGRVRFVPGNKNLIADMKNKVSVIINELKNPDSEKEIYKQSIGKDIELEFSDGCVGIVEVNAEPIRAYEVGKEEVRRAIDLLRFSSKAIYPLKEDIRIGLKGDYPKTNRLGLITSENCFKIQDDSEGSVFQFEINHESLERMNDLGVFKVSEALVKKQASNFEESLIRSIHWFSVALTQNENSNAFLFLIVALESLFKAERGNSIGGTVAESVAFLMSDNLEGRKKVISIMRDYYGKRSGVAHGGKKGISDIDCYTLVNIAGTSIMKAIQKLSDFTSQEQFMEWIEDQKLS